jgi:ribose-phosphate pyrophosphokinase
MKPSTIVSTLAFQNEAETIASLLGCGVRIIKKNIFPDGEWSFEQPPERGSEYCLIYFRLSEQTLVELVTLINILKPFSCKIAVCIPYLPSMRQKDNALVDLLAKSSSDLVDIYTIEPHTELDKVRSISWASLLKIDHFTGIEAVIGPDKGAATRAGELAEKLGLPVYIGHKKRLGRRVEVQIKINSNLKKVIIIDDIVSTGRTIEAALVELSKQGVEEAVVCVAHSFIPLSWIKVPDGMNCEFYSSDSLSLDKSKSIQSTVAIADYFLKKAAEEESIRA